jgi:hypothetical protein
VDCNLVPNFCALRNGGGNFNGVSSIGLFCLQENIFKIMKGRRITWWCFASVFMGFNALGMGLLSFYLKKRKKEKKEKGRRIEELHRNQSHGREESRSRCENVH